MKSRKLVLVLPLAHVLQLFRLGPGQYFAERHLLADTPYAASMVAKGPVRVLRLSRQWFEKVRSYKNPLLGPAADHAEVLVFLKCH